ncbi:MAG: RnfABCDGE type electron transport complex subunit A [bacterium]
MSITNLFGILISAMLINNIVLIYFLGLCAFFGVSTKMKTSLGMGFAVIFVMVMATAATWLIYHFVLVPLELTFLRTASFVLVIASLVQLVEIFLKKTSPGLYKALGIYLALITTNCAILAVAFLNIDYSYGLLEGVFYALGTGLGFTLAIILFAGIRERVALAPVPDSLKGFPIAFFIASLMSLAFLGFKGLLGL